MTTIDLPTLDHRAPANTYLTEFPDRLTAGWIDAQFDEIDARLAAAGSDGAAWITAVRHLNELASHVYTVFSRVRLAFRQASDNDECVAENRRLNTELTPAWSARAIGVTRTLAGSPCLDDLEAEFGSHYRMQIETSARIADPVNIPLAVELSEVLMQYTATFGTATIEWRGETLPISYARKAAHDTDETERRAAHASLAAFLADNEAKNDAIFDTAFDLRTRMAKNLGMKSYTELRYAEMQRFDWSQTEAAQFRSAIKQHVVPVAHELRQMQARQQGAQLVHPADTEIWPAREAAKLLVEVEEETAVLAQVLHDMGDRFADPFDVMREESLLDMPARPGKGTGAFCTSFPDQRVPYVFCNSVGTPEDITTLVHEYGHALQCWRSAGIELVGLRNPTLEACEIHSMTLELLVHPSMERFFGDRADAFREEHLQGTLITMPYLTLVDDFQHQLYDGERSAPHTAAERAELWKQLTLEYRPGLDWAADPDYWRLRWHQQLHIFQQPFYYLDYALARMVSWQLWLASLEDREAALETYLSLCDAGGTKPFRKLVLDSGLCDPFDEDVIADTIARLRPHLGLG